VLEAMACGLPVITTQYNGAGELVSPPGSETTEGFVIANPHDDVALAECMTKLISRELRRGMADAARKKSSRWTFDTHYQQMTAVLAEAAERKGLAA
jgi:UDP-glucose:(heptosyl)LPS alpha-1,3-glucosyltransferase